MTRLFVTALGALSLLLATPACSAPAATNSQAIAAGTDLGPVLQKAKPGQTLLLAPGVYPPFAVENVDFPAPVVITSADPARPAILSTFDVKRAGGLTFRDLEMRTAPAPGYYNFRFNDCRNVTLERISVHGSLDGNPQNDQQGVSFYGCDNFSIVDSDFQELVRAITAGPSQNPAFNKKPNHNVVISRNKLHNLQVTGMMLSAIDGGVISDNYITGFMARMEGANPDHPDAIQFLTGTNNNTLQGSRNVVIDGNLITRGTGNIGMQGIFITDEQGDRAPENFTISNQLMIGTGYNGIAINNPKNLKIDNNALHSLDPDKLKTWITVIEGQGVVLARNQAIDISTPKSTGVDDKVGNKRNKPVAYKDIASVEAAWRAQHPKVPK